MVCEITSDLKAAASELGFALAGVCPAVSPEGMTRLREWLAAGYAGEMHYLSKRLAAYEHPAGVLDGARSILMLGMHYSAAEAIRPAAGYGVVSRYACGGYDYHDLIHQRLKVLSRQFQKWRPAARIRGVVDTAPLLEREFAQLAGLGWIGKNTLLLNRGSGSYFFLAALLTDLELEYDTQRETDHCGSCTACLEACPTGAFPAPYQLDATRCISYLTIELRSQVPASLRGSMGEWVFGCDICQDVCPWNQRAPGTAEAALLPRADLTPLELGPLFFLSDAEFRDRFRETPLWRPKRRGMLRNAAIVLGNQTDTRALSPLARGLSDNEPLVRAACAWALGELDGAQAERALRERLEIEQDVAVRAEIKQSLTEC